MRFEGRPNYISSKAWFDGTDYSRITLGAGCTISSNVSFLTHDWSLHTIAKSFGVFEDIPSGRHGPISIGENSFIGRGVILLPNSSVGRGSIVGAGAVVRGIVPENSIYIGNPGSVVSGTEEYYKRYVVK